MNKCTNDIIGFLNQLPGVYVSEHGSNEEKLHVITDDVFHSKMVIRWAWQWNLDWAWYNYDDDNWDVEIFLGD